MRVFKVADGTSWTARADDEGDAVEGRHAGWAAIVFEATPPSSAHRLAYRPPGWLEQATVSDLIAALDESVTVRVRWGSDPAV